MSIVDSVITAFFGSKKERDVKELLPIVAQINEKESWAQSLAAEDFPKQTELFKERLKNGETLESIIPEAFALVREAAFRVLGERPYDTQIMGAIVLNAGKIAELKTGEGKTLMTVPAAYLNALTGNGVHVITVNDYLAERNISYDYNVPLTREEIVKKFGDFVANDVTKAMVTRINGVRTEIDRILRAGGFICFGDGYSRVTGDARTAKEMLEVLPEIMQHGTSAEGFVASVRQNQLYFLTEPVCLDIFRNRVDYRALQELRARRKKEQEFNDMLKDVSSPQF